MEQIDWSLGNSVSDNAELGPEPEWRLTDAGPVMWIPAHEHDEEKVMVLLLWAEVALLLSEQATEFEGTPLALLPPANASSMDTDGLWRLVVERPERHRSRITAALGGELEDILEPLRELYQRAQRRKWVPIRPKFAEAVVKSLEEGPYRGFYEDFIVSHPWPENARKEIAEKLEQYLRSIVDLPTSVIQPSQRAAATLLSETSRLPFPGSFPRRAALALREEPLCELPGAEREFKARVLDVLQKHAPPPARPVGFTAEWSDGMWRVTFPHEVDPLDVEVDGNCLRIRGSAKP